MCHYLIITNISKRANIRALLNVAIAFGCTGVYMIGQPKFNVDLAVVDQTRQHDNDDNHNIEAVEGTEKNGVDDNDQNDGSEIDKPQQNYETNGISINKDIPKNVQDIMRISNFFIQRFGSWDSFIEHCRVNRIRIVGIEIHDDAISINDDDLFDAALLTTDATEQSEQTSTNSNSVAFLVGNEGTGILPKHMKDCTTFVYIPQYGNGTASLNVYVAASIVLHKYQNKNLHWQNRTDKNIVAVNKYK